MISLTDPQTFYSNIPVSTVQEAFTSKELSIAGISRALNDPQHLKVRALLNIIIGDIIRFMNVGKTMTGPQLIETVGLVVKHYGHLKPRDFKQCFEGVKKGNYGPLYDRIDGQVILSWLKEYDAERDYAAAEIASNRNEMYKMEGARPLLPEKATEATDEEKDEVFRRNIAILKARLAASKIGREKAKAEAAKTDRPKDPVYEMHQRWLQQFDDMHYVRPVKSGGGPRFVKKYGKFLDKSGYLEHKQWQYQQAINRVNKNKNQQNEN